VRLLRGPVQGPRESPETRQEVSPGGRRLRESPFRPKSFWRKFLS
jgi:hypothetical protein